MLAETKHNGWAKSTHQKKTNPHNSLSIKNYVTRTNLRSKWYLTPQNTITKHQQPKMPQKP